MSDDEAQTWHHGVVAAWWSEFNQDGPEIAYFQRFIEADGQRALDAACGTGRLLVPYLRQGLDVDGCDISADMLERCRARAEAAGLSPNLYSRRCTSSTCRGRTGRSSCAAASASAATARTMSRRSSVSMPTSSPAGGSCSTTRCRTPTPSSGATGERGATTFRTPGTTRGRGGRDPTARSTHYARASPSSIRFGSA